MNFKSKLSGLALASALALAPAVASAAPTISFSGNAGTFGNAPGAVQQFVDHYTFSVPTNGRITIKIMSTDTAGGVGTNGTNVNFNSTNVKLNGVTLDIVSRGVNELRQLINIPVVAGVQNIIVQGSSQIFGTYTGTLAFAVPEPATWGMMILGFGMIGAAMRRRRAVTKVSFA